MKLKRKADRFANKAHWGQTRKYTGEPYIVHPRAVANIVESVEHDKYMVAAALLHDTIEDVSWVTYREIQCVFGSKVANLVYGLTDVSKPSDGTRMVRKELDRRHILRGSEAVHTVKLADMIHNSETILKYDPGFSTVYFRECKLLLDSMKKGDSTLKARLSKIISDYYHNIT